ncbi:MAG: lipoprotein [Lysobacter sp.]|nr:lipoprotein [Lysobacter sp.]
MNARHALLLIALPLALAGCGNKGPLVMPGPAEEEAPVTPADTVPVETDVPDTMPAEEPALDPALDPIPIDPATVPAADGGDDADGNG